MTASSPAGAAILAGLAAGAAALVLLALVAGLPAVGRGGVLRAARIGGVGIGLAMLLAGLVHLLLGGGAARMALPFHLAGVRPVLALDAVSGFGLVALLPPGLVALAAGPRLPGALAAGLLLLGGAVLALLAADAGTLVLGVVLAGVGAAQGMRLRRAGGWMMVLPALALALAVPGGDGRFAAMRAAGPQAWDGAAMILAALLAAGGLAALRPGVRGQGTLAMPVVLGLALYLLLRLGVDLAGVGPAWWGVPVVLGGAVLALRGAMRAIRAPGLDGVLGGIGAAQAGMVAIGLGMAMAARGVDDGPAAALALAGALFGLLGFAWTQALWAVVAATVGQGAGTLALARLGGLGGRMRFSALGAGIGGLAATALPPGLGFYAVWLLLQAAATLPRGGGADWWVLGAGAAAALAGAAGLLGFAVLRVLGIAFLGRPRSPRGAVAEEAAPGWRWLLLGLGGAVAACGLVPGAVVSLAGPALRLLTGTMPPAGVLGVAPGMGLEGISPLGIAALLALAAGLVWGAVRARSPAGHRVAPAWEDGAGPAPSWLPFGDPATQAGPQGMAAGLLRVLPPLAVRWRLRWPAWVALPRLGNMEARVLEAGGPGGLALLLLVAWLLGLW